MPLAFQLSSPFVPRGDQPAAIARLCENLLAGKRFQTLLGITGSGKTFTVANVIAAVNRPTLILAPNKTLAAQLYSEMKELFQQNAVEYFVSYYDYYQPEAYIPGSDTFIEKDSIINDQIDRMRHAATASLLSRQDVIIVASVSCIYGIGSAESYSGLLIRIEKGAELRRDDLLRKLVDVQYQRNDIDFHRGTFRVRGDVVEVFPAYEQAKAIRIEFFGDEVEGISEIDPLRGRVLTTLDKYGIYPGSHYVTPEQQLRRARESIQTELLERLTYFDKEGRLLEKQRIEQRTMYDLEMLEQMGYCQGIENYSRHLSGRAAGEPPPTLIDYFPPDFLMIIDESHQTMPQVRAMYHGDRSRKSTLVDYGFRLPSALDNRPLRYEEFEKHLHQAIFVSATPADDELALSEGEVVEQVIRPTGLMDPEVEVRKTDGQVDNLLGEIRARVAVNERILVTTLTKRMAEDLTDYYRDLGVRVRYLHSDIETLERIDILRDLRLGEFDVLVGINLLREGLDLPEVSLVAILDADKEGFLRSARSLIQTIGRAARNVNGRVMMYADRMTAAMKVAIGETSRRREKQRAFNLEHGITPETVKKSVMDMSPGSAMVDYFAVPKTGKAMANAAKHNQQDIPIEEQIEALRTEMFAAAESLDFEKAARLRDTLKALQSNSPELASSMPQIKPMSSKRSPKRAGPQPNRAPATKRSRRRS